MSEGQDFSVADTMLAAAERRDRPCPVGGPGQAFEVPVFLLPAPTASPRPSSRKWSYLLTQLAITVMAAGLGLVISVVLGLVAGAAIAGSRFVDRMLTPWLVIAHAIPKVVIAPLFLVWFGFGLQSEMFFVVAFTFFPVIVNTVTGLKSADPEQLLMVRAMGATPPADPAEDPVPERAAQHLRRHQACRHPGAGRRGDRRVRRLQCRASAIC